MGATLSLPPLLGPWAELRVDVRLPSWAIETELRRLHSRMQREGDPLCGLPGADIRVPGFAFRYRVADGEHYVYAEDVVNRRLAGYTVFNRLVELDRRADRHLRSGHSKYGRDYQRRGLASAVYAWALARGMCLITGARQSTGAHALWRSLARRFELGFVELKDKRLTFLGATLQPDRLQDFHVRMVLLGEGWSPDSFVERTGACRAWPPPLAEEPWHAEAT